MGSNFDESEDSVEVKRKVNAKVEEFKQFVKNSEGGDLALITDKNTVYS